MANTKWTMDKVSPGDKQIDIYAGEIAVAVDRDDCDHDEAEMVARFIIAMAPQYADWKAANAIIQGPRSGPAGMEG